MSSLHQIQLEQDFYSAYDSCAGDPALFFTENNNQISNESSQLSNELVDFNYSKQFNSLNVVESQDIQYQKAVEGFHQNQVSQQNSQARNTYHQAYQIPKYEESRTFIFSEKNQSQNQQDIQGSMEFTSYYNYSNTKQKNNNYLPNEADFNYQHQQMKGRNLSLYLIQQSYNLLNSNYSNNMAYCTQLNPQNINQKTSLIKDNNNYHGNQNSKNQFINYVEENNQQIQNLFEQPSSNLNNFRDQIQQRQQQLQAHDIQNQHNLEQIETEQIYQNHNNYSQINYYLNSMNYLNLQTNSNVNYQFKDEQLNQDQKQNQNVNVNQQGNNNQGLGKVQENNQNTTQTLNNSGFSTDTNNLPNQIQNYSQQQENQQYYEYKEGDDDDGDEESNDYFITNNFDFNNQCEVQKSQFNCQNQSTLYQHHNFANKQINLNSKQNEIYSNPRCEIKPDQFTLNPYSQLSQQIQDERNKSSFDQFSKQDDNSNHFLLDINLNHEYDVTFIDNNLPFNNELPYYQIYQQNETSQEQIEFQYPQLENLNYATNNQNNRIKNIELGQTTSLQTQFPYSQLNQQILNERNESSFDQFNKQDDNSNHFVQDINLNNQQDVFIDNNLPFNKEQPYYQIYQWNQTSQEQIEFQYHELENIELRHTTSLQAQFHPELQNLTNKNDQSNLYYDKIKKKRQRKTKMNAINKPSYSETHNFSYYAIKLLLEQISIYYKDFKYKKTSKYIAIEHFQSKLQTHLDKLTQDEQEKFKKTVLNIIDIILIQKAQNQKNLKAFFAMIKYIPAIRIMVQNLGKFTSFKKAQKYALNSAQSSSISETSQQLFANYI